MKTIPVMLLACSLLHAVSAAGAGRTEPVHVRYHCDNDTFVEVTYGLKAGGLAFADISFNDLGYHLKQSRAASGARYAADGVVWWNKGNQGILRPDERASYVNCLRIAL